MKFHAISASYRLQNLKNKRYKEKRLQKLIILLYNDSLILKKILKAILESLKQFAICESWTLN